MQERKKKSLRLSYDSITTWKKCTKMKSLMLEDQHLTQNELCYHLQYYKLEQEQASLFCFFH